LRCRQDAVTLPLSEPAVIGARRNTSRGLSDPGAIAD